MTADRVDHPLPSWEIDVRLFRMILFLPFAIEPRNRQDSELASGDKLVGAVTRILEQPEYRGVWRQAPNLCWKLGGESDEDHDAAKGAYEEFEFFHPYTQRFLYGEPDENAPANEQRLGHKPLMIYCRNDVRRLNITYPADQPGSEKPLCLDVDRIALNLFDTGNAILTVELFANPLTEGWASLSLSRAMIVTFLLRRVFEPFQPRRKEIENKRLPPTLSQFAWDPPIPIAEAGDPFEDDAAAARAHVRRTHTSPLRREWRELLQPLKIEGYEQAEPLASASAVLLSQCGDDRVPYMLMLGVEDPTKIGDADWYRLCFTDKPGQPGTYPVASAYAEGFLEHHAFDRYWEPSARNKRTRYLCSGLACTVVGACRPLPGAPNGSANDITALDDFRDLIQTHFRRHYYQLALISHFHRLALLTLSERLARALPATIDDARAARRFREQAQIIQQDVLRFTNRYWFLEVTAQPQGQELFSLWRRHLRTEELYQQLSREVEATNAFLDRQQQMRLSRAAWLIAAWGAPGLVLAVLAGFFGMNVFTASSPVDLSWHGSLSSIASSPMPSSSSPFDLSWHGSLSWARVGQFSLVLLAVMVFSGIGVFHLVDRTLERGSTSAIQFGLFFLALLALCSVRALF